MEAEINATVAEIALEMEIIVLEKFRAASAKLDGAVEVVAAKTSPILAEYEAMLAELVPDVAGHLSAAASLAEASAASLAAVTEDARPAPGVSPASALRAAALAAEDDVAAAKARDSRLFAVQGASPLTATLVVLGALFAGVAFAGGNKPANDGTRRRANYESLL
jgi:hypothetical protein